MRLNFPLDNTVFVVQEAESQKIQSPSESNELEQLVLNEILLKSNDITIKLQENV